MTKTTDILKKDINDQLEDLLSGNEKSTNEFINYMIEEFNKNKKNQEKSVEYLKQLTQEHSNTSSKINSLISANASYVKDIKIWLERESI